MPKKHFDLIIIDSDETIITRLEKLFSSQGYNVLTAKSPGQALELLTINTPPVVITEINFPGMTSSEFVTSIRRQSFGTVIVTLSDSESYNKDKSFFLEPIFRTLNKPSDDIEIQSAFNDAMQSFFENFTLQGINNQKSLLKRQLNHMLLQQTLRNKKEFNFYLSILENIRHSVTQGMGLGGLITALDMSEFAAKREGGNIIIEEDLYNDIIKEKESCATWIELLNKTKEGLETKYKPEEISQNEFEEIIDHSIEGVEKIRKIGDHKIIKNSIVIKEDFFSNKVLLNESLRELLLNALKYSPENSTVSISAKQAFGHISISILNEEIVTTGVLSGIPKSLEEKVFEPFFRVNNTFNEKYGQFSLGLGIGLTFVKNALNRINSKIFIHSAHDSNGKAIVNVEVNIPTKEIARIKKVNKTELLSND